MLEGMPKSNIPVMGSITQTDVDWHLPRHSWDTHVHVFNPAEYPYSPSRAYTPDAALYESLLEFNGNLSRSHRPQNLVLVQPSVYGTDNGLIINLLKKHGRCGEAEQRKLRAIVVIDEHETDEGQLQEWDDLGVRGFRINTEAAGNGTDYEHLRQKIINTAERVKSRDNWKCQLFISGDSWDYLANTLRHLPVKIIADHQGGMKGMTALPANITSVTEQPGYASMISLAKSGRVYIKISGLYRSSKLTTGGYGDLEPLIKAFVEEVPGQLLWGSDWPHTGSGANRTEETKYIPEKFRDVDDIAVLKNLRTWMERNEWERMMIETAGKVYD
ncbi:hypothetical protein BU24DRAFT_412526 [Aaosphaeria arxii CBS 175.79]|uniref:Amidohydrolase-related domain-containing protein n=1 Tax=Aaosphaeria arxii CBS 175.79 TaxID=1450172 RepID=A0A6A5XGC5_9PLEO|nr:uncharacterized protein BU24DRAFT_412526 [Aaosphaeria arxii CBS 175.79]KAF2011983.1 hypothetical protein BU24DRAFT_412526 [Aaosphaeria arxii CBS 175.79]